MKNGSFELVLTSKKIERGWITYWQWHAEVNIIKYILLNKYGNTIGNDTLPFPLLIGMLHRDYISWPSERGPYTMLAFTSRSMSQIASSECCQTQLTGHQKKGFSDTSF